jgi:hypothetical protein
LQVKPARYHIPTGCFTIAILACQPTISAPAAQAKTAAGIEQAFAGSMSAMWPGDPVASGAFIGQGRAIRGVGKN